MGWWQLVDIFREAREEARRQRALRPQACPICGEPLREAPTPGVLYCPFDGWQWPRDTWALSACT